jgi:hypothetical protein
MAPISHLLFARRTSSSHSGVGGSSGGGIGGGVVAAIIILMMIVFICVYISEYNKGTFYLRSILHFHPLLPFVIPITNNHQQSASATKPADLSRSPLALRKHFSLPSLLDS